MNHLFYAKTRAHLRVPASSLLLIMLTSCNTPQSPKSSPTPEAPRSSTVDTYHGEQVADPYAWMEVNHSEQTQQWIDAQNEQSRAFLDSIPQRTQINDRLTELWDYEKMGSPWKKGDRYFQYRNDGLQNHYVLYTMDELDAEPRVLIDPNTLSEDGTVSVSSVSISEDGRWAAYALSQSGSDWREVHIRNVQTGADLEDHLKWIKFSTPSWDNDGKGFYYGRYEPIEESSKHTSLTHQQRLYYHRLATPQSEDVLIYENADEPKWGYGAGETEDGKYLIMYVWQGSGNRNALFYRPTDTPDAPFTPLFDQFDASYNVIDTEGDTFWIETNHQAPRSKVVAVDLTKPQSENWITVIPEQSSTLDGATIIGDQFVCNYLQDARSLVKLYALDGTYLQDLDLPGIGTVGGFKGKRSDHETFFSFSSFTTPTTIYHLDLNTQTTTLFGQPEVAFDPTRFTTEQAFIPSKDGTRVPLFISYRKDLPLRSNRPTLLYGYGGFGASITPRFSVTRLVWMEMGGVYVVANIRGGGEYGEAWHQAGTKLQKQNVFDDFIAAAEWLQEEKITSNQKLAIEGGSNGGLLVGACLTQRPDLFGAALPAVGVMDMLKYHTWTIGWAWASDYGTVEDADEFRALRAYSPYHNTRPANYPPTLVTTADTDDRVVPSHSFKFTAALQHAQTGSAPILIRVDRKAGHGGGKPTAMIIAEQSDKMAFLHQALKRGK